MRPELGTLVWPLTRASPHLTRLRAQLRRPVWSQVAEGGSPGDGTPTPHTHTTHRVQHTTQVYMPPQHTPMHTPHARTRHAHSEQRSAGPGCPQRRAFSWLDGGLAWASALCCCGSLVRVGICDGSGDLNVVGAVVWRFGLVWARNNVEGIAAVLHPEACKKRRKFFLAR